MNARPPRSIRRGSRRAARGTGALLAAALALAAAVAGAAGGGHGREAVLDEPVPTGQALVERCRAYAEDVAFLHHHLQERTVIGRLNLVKARYDRKETFLDRHCRGGGAVAARGDGGGDG